MINKGQYWRPEPEVWDAAKCAKIAKQRRRDGYGTLHPYPGLVQATGSPYGYGKRRFNGGCVREGDWWEGEDIPYPVIPDEFVFVLRPTWGVYIVRREDSGDLKVLS